MVLHSYVGCVDDSMYCLKSLKNNSLVLHALVLTFGLFPNLRMLWRHVEFSEKEVSCVPDDIEDI